MSDVTPDNAQAGIDYIQRTTTYNFIDTGLMIDPLCVAPPSPSHKAS